MFLLEEKPRLHTGLTAAYVLPVKYAVKKSKAERAARRKARRARKEKKAKAAEQKAINEENAIDKPPLFFR